MSEGKRFDELDKKIASARRLKKAIECRSSFVDFVKYTMPDADDPENIDESMFKDAKHHRALAKVLEKVEKGHIPRLIVSMPPRHGKSELVSRRFVPWIQGRDPYRNVIFATYNEDFAKDFGADVRNIMTLPQYKHVFPSFGLRKGGASKSRIQTTSGGMSVFVGRGGSITGRGGDFVILDDPIKDSMEANSPTLREQLWQWFTQVLMTRLMTASASIVIVQTRWHEDDLIGRLTDPTNPHYSPEEAAKWKIINLPALAEDEDPLGRKKGELLWPERFDMEFMEAQRRLDPRGFSALYQGRPTAEDGDLFRRENIKYFNRKDLPEDMRIYAASDHAVGVDRTRNDATCLLIVGVDRNDDIFLLDCWWEKRTTDKVVDAMLELMSKWKPLIWWAEKGHISKAIGPFLRKRMAEEKVYCRIEEVTPVANKVQRAQSILGRMAMNKVLFPRQSVWTQKATDEILKFPNGRNDDFVDTLAWIGMGLARLTTPGGGIVKTDSLPKVGTLAWVKWDAAQRRKQQFLEHRTGGW
jgi:predicted phage terminase large subunit-like protein|tara:strand:- start:10871 stop:12451 length:1581 start_codon:yes stop_codon:yes gene_type:complete